MARRSLFLALGLVVSVIVLQTYSTARAADIGGAPASTPALSSSTKTEIICSVPVTTKDEHNVLCEKVECNPNKVCSGGGGGNWCILRYDIRLSPVHGGRLSEAHFDCARDNEGSCSWNQIGNAARESFSEQPDHSIIGTRGIGSRSIMVRICATETW